MKDTGGEGGGGGDKICKSEKDQVGMGFLLKSLCSCCDTTVVLCQRGRRD